MILYPIWANRFTRVFIIVEILSCFTSLTLIFLFQDDYKYVHVDDTARTNWAPVLANIGLLIITAVECLATIAAAFRCYWYVCRCRRRRRRSLVDRSTSKNHQQTYRYDSPDMTTASYCSSSRSKQKLVRCWLGQQSAVQSTRSPVPFVSPYGPVPPYYTVSKHHYL